MALSERTRANLQLGTIIAGIGAVVTAAWVGRGVYDEMNKRIDALAARATGLEDSSYSLSAASEQALRMAIENPGMRVPDPRDPNKIIVVKAAEVGTGPVSMSEPPYATGSRP